MICSVEQNSQPSVSQAVDETKWLIADHKLLLLPTNEFGKSLDQLLEAFDLMRFVTLAMGM